MNDTLHARVEITIDVKQGGAVAEVFLADDDKPVVRITGMTNGWASGFEAIVFSLERLAESIRAKAPSLGIPIRTKGEMLTFDAVKE